MRLGACILVLALAAASAAQAAPSPAAGQRFARRACAGCHAIKATGAGPNPLAPPFRLLASRLRGPRLDAELRAISRHGHRSMPPIYMTPAERRNVAAYIRSISARPPHRRA
jgi:mono/diheme cytochrome c family protein